MASAVDQPLKKRKLYDSLPDPSPDSHQGFASAPQTQLPLSQEEILQRRRNREEIRSLYDCYKKIRFCVSQKDARLMPDFEQAYLSLITASRGCTSVQRIVAELIPRYASFCPTALEAAAKVSINMYSWSFGILVKGEDLDGVAYETAKACIFGLVDICFTAAHEAPTSSVISGICSAVFRNVLTFLSSTFEGKDIHQIGCSTIQMLQEPIKSFYDLKQDLADDKEPPLEKLSRFRALSLLRIFFSFPKNLLAACFELLVSSGTDPAHRKGGEYFLNQLTSYLNLNEATLSSNREDDGVSLCADSTWHGAGQKGSEDMNSIENDKNNLKKPLLLPENCLMRMALHKEPSLRNWLLQRYKKLCESASSENITVISSFLEKIFASLSDAVNDAGPEENNEDHFDPSKSVSAPQVDHTTRSEQCDNVDASKKGHQIRMQVSSVRDALYQDNLAAERAAERDAGKNMEHTNSMLSPKCDPQSSIGSLARESEGSASLREIRNLEISGQIRSTTKDMASSQFISPGSNRKPDLKIDDSDARTHATEVGKVQASNIHLGLPLRTPASGNALTTLQSPRHQVTVYEHASYNRRLWFYDADPGAMDVFPASKLLWLGSLGREASEKSIRLQFGDFGPLVQLTYVTGSDFALIEYRNIMDAVRAREFMHGSSPWGGCLQIKFVDRGLGSRGVASSIAVGDSCHVYIGKTSTQWAKDEIMQELMMAGIRKPCITTNLTGESALLLEFGSAEEATSAIACIQRLRKNTGRHAYHDRSFKLNECLNDKFVSGCQLLVRQIDASVSDEELINAFSRYGELSWWQFNRTACCCLIDFRSRDAAEMAMRHLHGARFGATHILVELRAENSGTAGNHKIFSPPAPPVPDSSASQNKKASGYFPSHGDVYPSSAPNHYSSSFMYRPEANMHELVSPRLNMERHASQVHIGHSFQSNWAINSSIEVQEAGLTKFDDYRRSAPLGHSLAGPMTPRAEQVWQFKNQEFDSPMMTQGTQPCPTPTRNQGPSFVRPLYFNPSDSWDSSSQNPPMSSQLPTSMIQVDNHYLNARPAVPFVPSSVTPVPPLHGGTVHHSDQTNSVPSLQTPVPPVFPPDAPPPLPSSPPPLPLSQPPSVPPPPTSPPPQGDREPSSLQAVEPRLSCQWQGTLSKSGIHYCTIYAIREESAACKYSASISEPTDWPVSLDITKRTDIRHVKATFAGTRLHRREVCRLLPSTADDHKGFHDFITYLKQRDCAGVIKIPGGKSLWTRLLFILPHSPETCSLLGISLQPADCLIGLVLPKDTSTEGT